MKTKGFTLVETMVALLLITLSFSIWMMVFANLDFSQSSRQLSYSHHIDAEFSKSIQEELFFDQDYFVDEIAFSRNIAFLETDHCLSLELTAFLDGEMIGKRKEIIYLP